MRTRAHYRRLCWFALAGILVQSLIALDYYYRALPAAERADLESLVEHSATLAMNGAFVFVVGLLFFAGNRVAALAVGVISVPIAVIYLLSQRRASMVALLVAFFALLGFLFIRRRRAFWRIAPPAIGIGILAVLGTWNAEGAIGLPANAVKSVLFPSTLSEGDQGSDVYRQIEAFNLWVTIRSNPVGGFGFGHEFLVVIPLPDISFFEYWRYLPHNSVLWVWIQLGFFGFVAFLFVFARAIQLGARAVTRAESGTDAALIAVGCTYVMMYLVFAYVDIVWDIRPAVVLAVALALCADYEFAGSDEPTPATRDRAVRASPTGGRRASLR